MAATRAYSEAMGLTPPTVRRSPGDAFALARERFREGRKIDMVGLAESLGVARATLYRWTGDRDQLLGDVAWAEFSDTIAALLAHHPERGLERVRNVTAGLLRVLAGNAPLQAFLRHEGADGLRLLTSPGGPVRPRLVEVIRAAIADEAAHGYRPPAPPEQLADGIVSLGERFLYNGGDPGLNPDPHTAGIIIGLLLRE